MSKAIVVEKEEMVQERRAVKLISTGRLNFEEAVESIEKEPITVENQVSAVEEPMSSVEKRKRLIEEHAHLVKYIAYRLAMRLPAHVNVRDLISAGTVGLIEAIDRFDSARGVKLETFAYTRIKGAMLDELRAVDWVSPSIRQKARQLQEIYTTLEARLNRPPTEEETAKALEISVEDLLTILSKIQGAAVISIEDLSKSWCEREEDYLDCLHDVREEGPEEAMNVNELKGILGKAIDVLPEKERLVLSLYYYDELTLKEVGKVMGLTESRICQLHSQAVLRLKGRLKHMGG